MLSGVVAWGSLVAPFAEVGLLMHGDGYFFKLRQAKRGFCGVFYAFESAQAWLHQRGGFRGFLEKRMVFLGP